MSSASSDDPWLVAAQRATRDFLNDEISAEAALDTIWEAMRQATDAGFPAQPYVDLTDSVTFPEETQADRATEAAWAAEVQERDPEND